MTENYTVQARLEMTSNVPEVIKQLLRGFEDVNNVIRDTQENLRGFTTSLRELSGGGRGIGRLVSSMEKLSQVKLGKGILPDMERMGEMTRQLTENQQAMARSASETAAAWRAMASAGARAARAEQEAAAPRPRRSRGQAAPADAGSADDLVRPAARKGGKAHRGGLTGPMTHGEMMDAGMGAQMAGDAGASLFERSIGAELEVQQYLTNFRMNTTLTDGDIARIRSRAEALVRSVPGTTIAENLHTILDAYTVVGDVNEAMAGAKSMAELNLLFQSLPGQHHGDQGFAAAQAVELMQRFYNPQTHQPDIAAMNREIGAIAQVAAGTGGRADPAAYRAFAKQARVGGMLANDQFLFRDLPAMLIALNGSRAGTGDAAVWRQFMQGRMTNQAAEELKHYGVIDQSAKWSHGRVVDMMKHLHGSDEFVQNEVQWVRDYLFKELAAHGVDTNDRKSLGLAAGNFASTNVGLGFLSEMLLGMQGIDKEAGKIGQTTDNPLGVIAKYDPNYRVREFKAAENELMVTMGQAALGPAIDSLRQLTAVLREMSDWAKANPNMAKDIMVVGGAMSFLAKGAGELAMVLFFGAPVIKGLFALSRVLLPFGAGGAAERGMVGAAEGMGKLAGAAGAFAAGGEAAGALGGLAVLLGRLAAGAAGIGFLYELLKPNNSILSQKKENAQLDALFPDRKKDWHVMPPGTPEGLVPAPGSNPRSAPNGVPHVGPTFGAPVRPESYLAPEGGHPITVRNVMYLDGKVVYESVTRRMGASLARPLGGGTGFDPSMTPQLHGNMT